MTEWNRKRQSANLIFDRTKVILILVSQITQLVTDMPVTDMPVTYTPVTDMPVTDMPIKGIKSIPHVWLEMTAGSFDLTAWHAILVRKIGHLVLTDMPVTDIAMKGINQS